MIPPAVSVGLNNFRTRGAMPSSTENTCRLIPAPQISPIFAVFVYHMIFSAN